MTLHIHVQETKWAAVGRGTTEQRIRWYEFVMRMEFIGRARLTGSPTLIGCDWLVDVDDQEHAEWLQRWLIDECGYTATMLRIRR